MTFRESEPYYKNAGDLEQFLGEFSPVIEGDDIKSGDRREGGSGGTMEEEAIVGGTMGEEGVVVGTIPYPMVISSPERPVATKELQVYERRHFHNKGKQTVCATKELQVYQRRHLRNQGERTVDENEQVARAEEELQ